MFQKVKHVAGKLLSLMKKRQFLVTSISALVMLVALISVWNYFILPDNYSMDPVVIVDGDENSNPENAGAAGNVSPSGDSPALAEDRSSEEAAEDEPSNSDAAKAKLPEPDLAAMTEPVAGQVVKAFGFTFSPTYEDYRYHGGIDVAASVDTPVNSVLEGIVSSVTYSEAEGYKIVIDHGGGWQSVYAHLQLPRVEEGEKVDAGQLIARIGNPGIAEAAVGNHVHLEIIHNGHEVDPLEYLHYETVLH